MVGFEVAAKAVGEVAKEVAKETAKETAKEAAKETAKEVGKEAGKQSVDITKRVDISAKVNDSKATGVDITKRIQPERMGVKEIARDYIADLKAKSDFPDSITNSLDVSKLEKRTPEENAKMREDFDKNKAKLRSDWEKLNNKEWPRYTQPVYNEKGKMIRKIGDCLDAHHVQPLELGGKNEASNITPLDLNKHKDIHSKTGSCTKLVEKVVGGQ